MVDVKIPPELVFYLGGGNQVHTFDSKGAVPIALEPDEFEQRIKDVMIADYSPVVLIRNVAGGISSELSVIFERLYNQSHGILSAVVNYDLATVRNFAFNFLVSPNTLFWCTDGIFYGFFDASAEGRPGNPIVPVKISANEFIGTCEKIIQRGIMPVLFRGQSSMPLSTDLLGRIGRLEARTPPLFYAYNSYRTLGDLTNWVYFGHLDYVERAVAIVEPVAKPPQQVTMETAEAQSYFGAPSQDEVGYVGLITTPPPPPPPTGMVEYGGYGGSSGATNYTAYEDVGREKQYGGAAATTVATTSGTTTGSAGGGWGWKIAAVVILAAVAYKVSKKKKGKVAKETKDDK